MQQLNQPIKSQLERSDEQDIFYLMTKKNDQILRDTIKITNKSKCTSHNLNYLKKIIPQFMVNQWKNNDHSKSLSLCWIKNNLQKQNQLLQNSINKLNSQKQIDQISYQIELQKQQKLNSNIQQLKNKRQKLFDQNSNCNLQLAQYQQKRQQIYQKVNQLKQTKRVLQLQKNIYRQNIQKIHLTQRNEGYIDSEQRYYNQFLQVLNHIKNRSDNLSKINHQITNQIKNMNQLMIDMNQKQLQHQQNKDIKQEIKQKIKYTNTLSLQLESIRKQKKQVNRELFKATNQISEQLMDEAVARTKNIEQRYQIIFKKLCQIAPQWTNQTQLGKLQHNLNFK